MTLGVVSRFRLENVFVPAQPLKLYPTEIEVTLSSGDTVNVIGRPCVVVPLQVPALPAGAGEAEPQPLVNAPDTSATSANVALGNVVTIVPFIM